MSWRSMITRLTSSQRMEASAMILVAGVAAATLADKAYREPVISEAANDAAYAPSLSCITSFPQVASRIREGEVVIVDVILDEKELREARKDVAELHQAGRFGVNPNDDNEMRSDVVYWVTGNEAHVGKGLRHAINLLRGLANGFEETVEYNQGTLFVQSTAQLACYDGDGQAHYKPHLDASDETVWSLGLSTWLAARAYRERAITAILYLNDRDWDGQTHGGCLRCYIRNKEEEEKEGKKHGKEKKEEGQKSRKGVEGENDQWRVQDVSPQGGRLVLFDSKAILHEVLPSQDSRISLTVWVADRSSRRPWWKSGSNPPPPSPTSYDDDGSDKGGGSRPLSIGG